MLAAHMLLHTCLAIHAGGSPMQAFELTASGVPQSYAARDVKMSVRLVRVAGHRALSRQNGMLWEQPCR